MGIQFSLRRAWRDPGALPRLDELVPLPAEHVASGSSPVATAEGLVDHYVRRSHARPEPQATGAHATPAPVVVAIGRGTLEHAASTAGVAPRARRRRRAEPTDDASIRQRLVAAALAAAILFAGLAGSAAAEQYRYRVQPGDTLQSVADRFGVDPEAIARSSWFSNPGQLTPGDVIIIPEVGQAPADAAAMAADRAGTSPWAADAHWVVAGDTIESVAAAYGVDSQALLDANGLAWGDYIYPGDRLVIPGSADAPVAAAPAPSGASIWVPQYLQERSLSCEYAAASIATAAFGNQVPEWAFIDNIPVTLNPHEGYRGNIDGIWGRYDDWGIYAEPLVPILNAWGFAAEPFYSMGDASQLIAHLDAGHPVVVWLAMWGDTGRVYTDDGTYTVFAGSHVMTAYGYDDGGVYLSDPGTGTYRYYDWGTFLWMWGTIDGMSLAIYPA